MITKGVRGEVLITLDEHFKHFHTPETYHCPYGGAYNYAIWYERFNWDYIDWLVVTGELNGDITSNTGYLEMQQTTDGVGNGFANFDRSNVSKGTWIQEMLDVRAITGQGKLTLIMNSGEAGKYVWLSNFNVHRCDNLTYPV